MSVLLVGCNSTVLLCGTPGKPRSLNGTSNSTSFLVKFSTFSMKLLKADLSLCLSSLSAYECKKNKSKTKWEILLIFLGIDEIYFDWLICGMDIVGMQWCIAGGGGQNYCDHHNVILLIFLWCHWKNKQNKKKTLRARDRVKGATKLICWVT